jgi:prephenate dehydrogenase
MMERAARFVKSGAIVTDVGSVKSAIVAIGENLFGFRFLGGHPMAGSEASGVAAANPDLFEGAPWVFAVSHKPPVHEEETGDRLHALVSALGARPITIEAALHDRLVALVSHLPHAISFAYSQTLTSNPAGSAAKSIAGSSYHDIARISRSSPELWADIFAANRDELLRAIREFESSIKLLRAALETGERQTILQQLSNYKSGT